MKYPFRIAALVPSLLCLALLASLATAHTEHASTTPAPAAPGEAFGEAGIAKDITRTVEIRTSDAMRFDPSSLSARQGETLRLRIHNDGKLPHEFVLGTQAEIAEHAAMMRQMPNMTHADASSVRVAPGASADIVWKFSHAGKFFYACLIPGHWEAGMQGSITVSAKSAP